MKKEQIIEMALEAGFIVDGESRQHQPNCIFHTHHMVDELLKRFHAIAVAAERKRLADKIALMPFGDTAASFAVWIRNGGEG